jgi:hypothetical protein
MYYWPLPTVEESQASGRWSWHAPSALCVSYGTSTISTQFAPEPTG